VGSGSGLNILEQALQAGWSCALVEADKLGGTCLTRGCIPSKVLTVPADIIREAEHARRLGLEFPRPKIEWPTVGRRMWQQINESLVIEEELAGFPKVAVYRGVGEFTAPRRMRVKLNDGSGYSEEFSARRFVLATGARSFVPPIQGLEETGYLTTETFFGDKFPQAPWSSLAIIGGGLIAAELGHVFSAFGTRVTILEMEDRLVPTEEPEICDLVARMFRTLMDVRLGVRAVAARTGAGGRKVVSYVDAHTGRTGEVEADEILVAAGRRSNADLLQADRAGIKLDRKGWIEADRHLQTSSPDVWAIGDAIGGFQFRHKANSDADVCAHNLLEPGQAKLSVDYSVVPWAIYTHPQVGHVGLTERQALDAGSEILVAVQHYSDIARGFAMGYEPGDLDDGLVKLVVDRSGRILGAHVAGPQASVLVQPFVYLMNAGFSCQFPDKKSTPLSKEAQACPEGGTVMPIFHSMVIHPSLNEVTAWAINLLEPVSRKKSDRGGAGA
jgi:mycothione reductase